MNNYTLRNGYTLKFGTKINDIDKSFYFVLKNDEVIGFTEIEINNENVIFSKFELFPCVKDDIKTELINNLFSLGNVTIELRNSKVLDFFSSIKLLS